MGDKMSYLAYDLGTGGVKASLYDDELHVVKKVFIEYPTYYPEANCHEQEPLQWWNAIVKGTSCLFMDDQYQRSSVRSLALSGHSLVTVPIGKGGVLLRERVPIWSDTRSEEEVRQFFSCFSEREWYELTGNGFPPACYGLFKLMWLKKHDRTTYDKIDKVLGSKDYINYKLTGVLATDTSYASGWGMYDLVRHQVRQDVLDCAGIRKDIIPPIVSSHSLLGTLTVSAAKEIGLSPTVCVAAGGVDNACMALGAIGNHPDTLYLSLGSSSWIAANTKRPFVDFKTRPYTFAHIEEHLYTSAFSIFSGGNSLRWARDTLCKDLLYNPDSYKIIDGLAQSSPIGAHGVYFSPDLAGSTSQDSSPHMQGGYLGLHLGVSREDMLRATMEGIALNLHVSLDYLKTFLPVSEGLIICGGGSKSKFWLQMFSDVFDIPIIKENIDQDCATFGAAAIASRAARGISDYSQVDSLRKIEKRYEPNQKHVREYAALYTRFRFVKSKFSEICDYLWNEK